MERGRAFPSFSSRHSQQCGWAVLALLLASPFVGAAEPQPTQGIGLTEAIRLMLEQDPNLAIEQARLRSARGLLLSAEGAFDAVLSTSLEQTDTDTPLTEVSSRE